MPDAHRDGGVAVSAKARHRRRYRKAHAIPQPAKVVHTSHYDNHVAAWLVHIWESGLVPADPVRGRGES